MTKEELLSKYPNCMPYKGGSLMTNGMFFTIKNQYMQADSIKQNHIIVTGSKTNEQYIANLCNGFCYKISKGIEK